MKALVILGAFCLLMFSGCDLYLKKNPTGGVDVVCGNELPKQPQEPPQTKVLSTTSFGYSRKILTVAHDKHWFIITDASNWGNLMHHPDCPCGKKIESTK